MRFPSFFVSLGLAALLASCGGGGGGPSDSNPTVKRCSDTYSFAPRWYLNGSFAPTQRLDGKVGEAFRATLELKDLQPAACVGLQSFQLGPGVTLPRGLQLDTATGTVSGVPLEAKELAGTSVVEVVFPGFNTGTTALTTLSIAP